MPSWFVQSACALGRERFALLCYEDDVEADDPNRLCTVRAMDVNTYAKDIKLHGEYVSICKSPVDPLAIAVLATDGAIKFIDFSGVDLGSEHIGPSKPSVNHHGFITTVRAIGNVLYACGMGGQVYKRISRDDWRLISKELCTENIYERWFSNIDGIDSNLPFCSGLEGALYHYDGSEWHSIPTNTSVPLGEMAFFGRDDLYVAGAQSTLLYGNVKKRINKVNIVRPNMTFYTICNFAGRLFVGSERGVAELTFQNNHLTDVDIGQLVGEIILLQAVEDVMWAFGAKFVRRYNGFVWENFDFLL